MHLISVVNLRWYGVRCDQDVMKSERILQLLLGNFFELSSWPQYPFCGHATMTGGFGLL